jgi:hypothetical protein
MVEISLPSKKTLPFTRVEQAANRAQRGRLSGPIATNQGDNFTFIDRQRDPFEGMNVAVVGMNILHFQHSHLAFLNVRRSISPDVEVLAALFTN